MAAKAKKAYQQLQYLGYELQMIANKRWWRYLTMWAGTSTGVVVSYRIDRAGYLFCGASWTIIRLLLLPLFLLLRLLSYAHDIHYKAEIGKGLLILHASLGIVVSAHAVIGENLTLTGGNCIGGRKTLHDGDLIMGDNLSLGANAVILGPVRIGNDVAVGAGAVVISDAGDDLLLVGVPARAVQKKRGV